MKINGLIVAAIMVALMSGSCAKNAISNAKMKNRTDSLSYAFGIVNYNALKNDSLNLEPRLVAKAMLDGEKGRPVMSDDAARSFIMSFISDRENQKAEKQAAANKVLYKDHIDQNVAFLENNKTKPGIIVTPSGLQYEVIRMGTGEKPTRDSQVKVHYVGTLIDGKEFDSSVKRNEPAQFPVTGVIPGWTEALQLMPVGSKFRLFIPENLAYGARGAGDIIMPYSTLIFEVELLEIVH
ncbi:MAG TPA: FKBP-type peptidyl-prolyl cis-trans isomerase [Bacteroidales bacterium]|jgi:FKBP-type peptidyl-prolyl cis-trans isomerase FklB|nr:FKBP-type peptidyl-prolyl cis-trans isomerase [Bacteroidales bacterium]HPM19539.1 FKBP-type peptidyl-prolyl cis-trans isomerase [Bacteroidales bacterium]HQG77841.1 FKBP-type peptidyl-prolyl cis-trans isomerase [Bacteroidales bacterium]